jgi:hypothetical protein
MLSKKERPKCIRNKTNEQNVKQQEEQTKWKARKKEQTAMQEQKRTKCKVT